ncbi:MAG: M13 family metallopeptidase, partial [Acidobacteriia bacterium]|nr:M13 family metallopeptidase [Terriglobia bacterium]
MRIFRCLMFTLLLAGLAAAQGSRPAAGGQGKKSSTAAHAAKPAAQTGAGTGARPATSFDPAALDKTADPCVDFYQFSCGGWLSRNPIPADQAAWGRFSELAERNLANLHDILEKAAKVPGRKPSQQRIGDYYAACMNEAAINKAGVDVLTPEFVQINAISNTGDLAFIVAHLHQRGVGAFFQMNSQTDFKDTAQVIAKADQGGLSLPDRDYYLKTDPKSVEIQKAFVDHLASMFKLLGDAPEKAAAEARAVMKIETALAKGSMDVTLRREPANVYHKMTLQEWQALNPVFSLKKYFSLL